ncbi:MAG: hypothetical protein ACP5NV_01525 [Candidatus Woesearchaeota archaeon]
MTMVGLNFTKISAEKMGSSDNVKVESNVAIINVVESKMSDPKKSIVKFQFNFTSKFQPNLGLIDLKGELIEIYDKELGTKIVESWTKGKSLHKDVASRVLNAILAKSNIEAILLSREIGLPSPVQMPKIEIKPKVAAPVKTEETPAPKGKKK